MVAEYKPRTSRDKNMIAKFKQRTSRDKNMISKFKSRTYRDKNMVASLIRGHPAIKLGQPSFYEKVLAVKNLFRIFANETPFNPPRQWKQSRN
jgi:hypothetical protein